jgi:adenylylsulfate kinase-like enzyme
MAPARRAPVVWINGFPGSGKLTVATAAAALDKTAIVLDKHKLIDPVEARFERSHPSYQNERRRFRQAALDKHVRDIGMLSRLVIFTGKSSFFCTYCLCRATDAEAGSDFQSNNALDRDVASE